jgi:predicted ArsR family transcriptional regulator
MLLLNLMVEVPMQPPNDSLLFHVKTAGPIQADQLAARLGISPQAVRQQMDRLLDAGLVQYDDRTAGPGRPKRFWSLTERGRGRFPDSHAQLTLNLIDAMREEFGEAALDRLIARRERDLTASYEAALAGQSILSEKIAALTALRQAEGYMASWQKTPDGFLLIEDHCPICAAAKACQGFCRSELALFRSALGSGCTVERTDHITAGARRCAYRIVPVRG